VSPVKYELGSYIPEDYILHSHRRGNLKSYIVFHFVSGNGNGSKHRIFTKFVWNLCLI
jgi:hypothetical protein